MNLTDTMKASNWDKCETRGTRSGNLCYCLPKCAICGFGEHTAIHGPYWRNGVLINKPWGGHEYAGLDSKNTQNARVK